MGLFKRKKDPDPVPPASLNELHSFEAPEGGYPAASWAWAPRIGQELTPIPNQDRILTHEFRPPPDQNPAFWYQERNSDVRARSSDEKPQPQLFTAEQHEKERAPDPRWNPPLPSRVTSYLSPSNYRFTRPFDQHSARRLNGIHFSMASMQRSYSVGGMNPVQRKRNTYRIEPPSRDMESVDLASEYNPSAQPTVYISPSNGVIGRSYRLGES